MKWFLPTALAVLLLSGKAHSYESLNKEQCSVIYNGRPPIHMECVNRSSMSQGAILWLLTMPDGRNFRIETGGHNYSEWFLNRKRAVQIGSCYKNHQVEICFENP